MSVGCVRRVKGHLKLREAYVSYSFCDQFTDVVTAAALLSLPDL